MANKSSYIEFLTDYLSPLGAITSRLMFGGHCLYADGVVFALVARDELFLKVNELTRHHFEERGLKQFHPFDDERASMNYFAAPAEFFENPDDLRRWGALALEAGRSSVKPKSKTTPRKTKRAVH